MAKKILKVATCQFAVGSNIRLNALQIRKFLHKAKETNAEIVHFPESALSGYAGTDFDSFKGFDWPLLKEETEKIMALAKQLRLWVVLGSSHRLTPPNIPHNSLYLISPEGKIVDRYDKRFCTENDLKYFTPGNHFVNFTINDVKCSMLICFDLRFPELYRQLCRQEVNCIFQSFYNARQRRPSIHTHIMRQTMQAHAATNSFWISMSNASAYYSPYGSCFILPDGKIARRLEANRAGMLVSGINLEGNFYDPSAPFRQMAIAGALDNGPKVMKDPRSGNRTIL
jgi:predicted amidohydrolase